MNIDIQAIVNKKIAELEASKELENLIQNGVEKAIENALERTFGIHGKMSRQIETSINERLNINLDDIKFHTYNEQMLSFITKKLKTFMSTEAAQRFNEKIEDVMATPPKEIQFNTFIEKLISMWRDENYDNEEIKAQVEITGGKDNSTVKIWKDSSDSTDTLSDIQLYLYKGKIRISHEQKYNLTCLNPFEAYIFNLYAAGTIIKNIHDFNEDECDLLLYEND